MLNAECKIRNVELKSKRTTDVRKESMNIRTTDEDC